MKRWMGSSEHLFWAPLCQHITVMSWAMWPEMSLHTVMKIVGHWSRYKAPVIRDAFSSGRNGCGILRVISIDVFVHFFIEYLHDLEAPKWFHPQPLRDGQGWTQEFRDQLKRHIHFPEVGSHRQHHMVLSLLNVLWSHSNLENLEAQLRGYHPLLSSSADIPWAWREGRTWTWKLFKKASCPVRLWLLTTWGPHLMTI